MKTATVRELRNHYSRLLRWLEAGEEIAISQRGCIVARLVPEKRRPLRKVDWSTSAALRRDRSGARVLSAEQTAAVLAGSQGQW